MKMNLITILSVFFAVTLCSTLSANAQPYESGQKVQSFTAADQHGTAFTFQPAETHYLLISHDMTTGKKANAALNALGKDHLPAKKAIYVANIHGMPGIGRFFAIPKMKRYAHRIILGDDADLIAKFPQQEGKVTVLKLSSGLIQSISYWTPESESVDSFLK
jgi:hypothetical protein